MTHLFMKARNPTHTHTQTQSNRIDYWNNNKASIIDPLVLFAYEIQAISSNKGALQHHIETHHSFSSWMILSRKQNKNHQ